MSNIVRTNIPRVVRMSNTDNSSIRGVHLRHNNDIFRSSDTNSRDVHKHEFNHKESPDERNKKNVRFIQL